MSKKRYFYGLLVCALLVASFLGVGKLLDGEAERADNNMHWRNARGLMEGFEPIVIKRNASEALVFIHGFLVPPAIFSEVIHDLQSRAAVDLYAPLLPFYGRNLRAVTQLKNAPLENFVENYLRTLSREYRKVTVVGFSYGGGILLDLIRKKPLPSNIKIILYAPSIYIKTNTLQTRWTIQAYHLWRDYCAYTSLGCTPFPASRSVERSGQATVHTISLWPYLVIPALEQLFQIDLANRDSLRMLHTPVTVLMAQDDNNVSYAQIKSQCIQNPAYCYLYVFKSGKHYPHLGKEKAAFEKIILGIAQGIPTHPK